MAATYGCLDIGSDSNTESVSLRLEVTTRNLASDWKILLFPPYHYGTV